MTTLIDGEEPGGGGGSGPSIWREACLAASNTNIADLTNVDLETVFGPISSSWNNNQRLLVCLPASRDGLEPEDPSHEGIFLVTGLFGGFASLVRSADMSVSGQFVPGVGVKILEGAHGSSDYQLSVVLPFTLDTDAQSWTELLFQIHSDNAHGARGYKTSLGALLHTLATTIKSGFMSNTDKATLDSLGPGLPGPILWVSKDGTIPGTGTFMDPFVSIQDAIDSIPEPLVAIDARKTWVILIASGDYNEDLNINANNRRIILCGLGPWGLGDFTGSNWQPSTPRGITWNNNRVAIESIQSQLWITSLVVPGAALSTAAAYGTKPRISGDITITGLLGERGIFGGTFDLYGKIDATGVLGRVYFVFEDTLIMGTCDAASNGTIIRNTNVAYGDLLKVDTLGDTDHCLFNAGLTLNTSGDPLRNSKFFGAFTGPPGTGWMDGTTWKSFINHGGTFAGGAVLLLTDEGLAEQTEYSPTTAGDWNVSPTEVKAGLDELASRVKGLEGGTPVPLYEIYDCPTTVAVGDAVYLSGIDTVDTASAASDSTAPAIGFAVSKPTTTTVNVQYDGSVGGFSLLTPGNTYFLDTVLGGITDDISAFPNGAVEQKLGVARNTTTLLAKIDRDYTLIVV